MFYQQEAWHFFFARVSCLQRTLCIIIYIGVNINLAWILSSHGDEALIRTGIPKVMFLLVCLTEDKLTGCQRFDVTFYAIQL